MLEILIAYIKATFENSMPNITEVQGLAEKITDGAEQYPALYCTGGEYKNISALENYLYFRQTGSARDEESEEESTTGCAYMIRRTYPMVAVAYIPKSVYNTDNAFIDGKIAQNIANIITKANWQSAGIALKTENIYAEVGEINTNRHEVWASEYRGVEFAARLDHVYVSVEFDIIIEASESCLQNYDCNDETVTVEGDTIIVEISDSNAWHKDGDFLTEVKQIGSTNAVNWQLIHGGAVKATVTAAGLNIPAIVGDVALTGNLVVTGSIDYTSGAIQSLNGLTDKVQTFAIGSAGTDFNLVSAAGVHTFNIPDAGVGITGGLVNNVAQTFEGAKTFASAPILTGFTQGSVLFAGVGGVVSQDNVNFNYTVNGLTVNTTRIATANNEAGFRTSQIMTAAANPSYLLYGQLHSANLTAAANTQNLTGFRQNLTYNIGAFTGLSILGFTFQTAVNATFTNQVVNTTNGANARSEVYAVTSGGGVRIGVAPSSNANSFYANRAYLLLDSGITGGLVIRTAAGKIEFDTVNVTSGNISTSQNWYLGAGSVTASARLHVVGADATTANYVAKFYGFGLTNGPEIRNDAAMILGRLAADPASPINGMIYYNTTTGEFRGYKGGVWVNL